MNLYEKMSAITQDITAVAKNLNVGWGKSSYKAVGEADVLAAVKPAEAKHRVYSYPVDRQIIESGILTSVKSDGSESRQQFIRVQTTYRFVDMDAPESYIDITTYGDGVDSQDKAPGKAMTYGDKYALLKAYKIITGDDPDQEYSKPLKSKASAKPAEPNDKISATKAKAVASLLEKHGVREDYVCKLYGIKALTDLTESQHLGIVNNIAKFKQKQEEETE